MSNALRLAKSGVAQCKHSPRALKYSPVTGCLPTPTVGQHATSRSESLKDSQMHCNIQGIRWKDGARSKRNTLYIGQMIAPQRGGRALHLSQNPLARRTLNPIDRGYLNLLGRQRSESLAISKEKALLRLVACGSLPRTPYILASGHDSHRFFQRPKYAKQSQVKRGHEACTAGGPIIIF